MLFSFELFLSLLFVVSNVVGDENDDDIMVCLDLFNPDYTGQHCCDSLDPLETFREAAPACFGSSDVKYTGKHCCESIDPLEAFSEAVSAYFGSDNVTCDNIKCVLDKRGLMKGDNVDEDAVRKSFEKIIQEHPKDKDIPERVLRECLNGTFQEYPPEENCPAYKFFGCVFVNVQLGCTKWKSSDACTKMADSAKKCRELVDSYTQSSTAANH